MKHTPTARRPKPFLGVGFAVAVGCAAPRSALPPADAAAVERERLVQQELAFRIDRDRRQRLADLSWPLLRDGAPLCADSVAPRFGFAFESTEEYEEDWRAAGRAAGLREAPTVSVVARAGPADHAGIRRGDVLTHVGRFRLPPGRRGVELGYRWLREFAGEAAPFPAVPVRLQREEEPFVQELLPELLCDYPVLLQEDQSINAFADGSVVVITTGMMRFTESDAELQSVIAHEIAHNLAGHLAARRKNLLAGTLLGLGADVLLSRAGADTGGALTLAGAQVGARAYSQEFEREADYVGMYLLSRAGIQTRDVAMFWRRLAAESTGSIRNDHAASHPSTPERFIRLDAAHEEIEAKRRAGLPLLPNDRETP